MSDGLACMSAAEIAEGVRRRSLSPVEIVDACIAQLVRAPAAHADIPADRVGADP